MINKILIGIVLGGLVGCIIGVFVSVVLAYLHQFHPGHANFQRELWSLGAIFLAIMLGPVGGAIGILLGGGLMYWRTRGAGKSDV